MSGDILLGDEHEPPRTTGRGVWAMDCDTCSSEHYAWTCTTDGCGNALDNYQEAKTMLPVVVTCGPCGRRYKLTADWVAWWKTNVLGVP